MSVGPPSGVITVALVDDQPLVRAGFRMLVDSQPDLRVLVEAGDGRQAVDALARTHVDVVLMDVRMPVLDGVAATRELLQADPATRVLVLTTFDLDDYVLAAVAAGASGFLLKDAQPEELLAAIRTVHSGEAVVAASATRRLLAHVAPLLRGDGPDGAGPAGGPAGGGLDGRGSAVELDGLTVREREVLQLMARGLSNTEIAERLVLGQSTVKTHVGRVLDKTGSRDRVQAVVLAYRTGLVHPEDDLDGT
ncbi:response regulator [Aquipuribacter sp. MA13-6]|uniref:response regulator n=1 Tax=unclassified Aquipuribacter TaxID=2635084 RepID=UPI003EEAE6C0